MELIKPLAEHVPEPATEKIRAYLRFITAEYGFLIPYYKLKEYTDDEIVIKNLVEAQKLDEVGPAIKKIIEKWWPCSLHNQPEIMHYLQQMPFELTVLKNTLIN